jgi:hypothetical protein
MDEDIVQYMRNKYKNLLIGDRTAERAKFEIGSAYPLPEERTMILRGRNLVTGLPEAIEVSSIELREALAGSTNIIVSTIKDALDDTPPELVADLMESGICMAGGGSQLQGLTERVAEEYERQGMAGQRSHDLRGARSRPVFLEDYDNLRRLLVGLERGSNPALDPASWLLHVCFVERGPFECGPLARDRRCPAGVPDRFPHPQEDVCNRLLTGCLLFVVSVFVCLVLIALSILGLTTPLQGVSGGPASARPGGRGWGGEGGNRCRGRPGRDARYQEPTWQTGTRPGGLSGRNCRAGARSSTTNDRIAALLDYTRRPPELRNIWSPM